MKTALRLLLLCVSFVTVVLLVSQMSLAQPSPVFGSMDGLDEDEQAAMRYWGSLEDPNVAALLAAQDGEFSQTLGEAHMGYDKETGQFLDDPTTMRVANAPALLDPEKGAPEAGVIRFSAANLLTVTPGITAHLQQQLLSSDQPTEYLALQFTFPVELDLKEQLEAEGVVFGDPLNSLSFYAKIPARAATAVLQAIDQGQIYFVGQVPPALQISEGLQAQLDALNNPETAVAVTVQLFEPPTENQLARIQDLMTIQRRSDGAMFLIEGMIPADNVYALASHSAVQMVHEHIVNESGAFEMPDAVPTAEIQANLEGNLATGGDIIKQLGRDGSGVRVMVMDSGIAQTAGGIYHPDLPQSRIPDQYSYYPTVGPVASAVDSHGTHVAGSIGGSGVASTGQAWQGIAPGVNFLIYRLCCNAPGGFGYFNSDFQASLERGAANQGDVSNNSWGGGNNTYAVSSQLADRAVRGEFGGRWMNIVTITHNDNNLSRSPGTAKNAITVGAVKDGNWPNSNVTTCGGTPDTNWPPGQRICFSNFGPIDIDGDGHSRVKPDLMAPGVRTTSSVAWYQYASGQYYDLFNGTSMAAPQVTGGVAQFIQAYPGYRQWPEVVKAALIASATNVGGADIARYGRGMVNTFHAIYNQAGISSTNRWNGSVSTSGQNNNHTFTVPAGFSEVRVVLTWADPVAGANNDTVINDLDVRVYDANNTLRGSSLTIDDTVEYIKVTNGAPGTWRIEVRAFSISSTQPYGLAAVTVMEPAALDMAASVEPVIGTLPGSTLYLYTTLANSGFAAPGSYVRLQIPSTSLFTVEGARIYLADGRSYYYNASHLHNDVGGLYWRAAVGETIAGYPRVVRWFIRYNGPTSDCTDVHNFLANAYSRDNGGLAIGGTDSAQFIPALCRNYLPLLRR
jgi:serine protease AprX